MMLSYNALSMLAWEIKEWQKVVGVTQRKVS